MGDLFFWKNWHKFERAIYLSFLALFLLSLIYYLFAFFLGTDAIIDWIIISSTRTVDVISNGVNLAGLDLNYNIPNLVITEHYEGSEIRINYFAAYLFLALILISVIFYLAVITTLTRFWFLAGGSIFMFMMVGLKFDQLMVFGSFNNIPLYIIFGIYLPLLYYFNVFGNHISFIKRLGVFSVVTMILGFGIINYAAVDNPTLYIVNYGIIFPVIVSILFIISVAFEIVFAFLVITTRGNSSQSKNSLGHFSILTLIYLINLALVYAKNRQFLDWDIFYINEFVLLLISVIIGIWGFKQRSTLFENFLPFRFAGGLIYLMAAVICFGTIGYLFATGNDPFVETMEDAIIFSHLSFGLFFYLYIISNFVGLLYENLEVYKIAYQPQKMPYYVMRFVGLVGFGALFFESDQLALNQSIAGYYNGIGDLHTAVNNKQFAEQYYLLGSQFEYQNHRSNYGLANLAVSNDEKLKAVRYYKQSILKKPTPYAFANLSNLYQESGLYFDALFTLKEGLRSFPENPYLNNNIGLLYAKTAILDSTLHHLNLATLDEETAKVVEANLIGALTSLKEGLAIDSLLIAYEERNYLPTRNNLLVLSNIYKKGESQLFKPGILTDTVLNPNTYAYLYSGLINNKFVGDSSLSTLSAKFVAHPRNSPYAQFVAYGQAVSDYYNDDVAKAFNGLKLLMLQNSSLEGVYSNQLGLWAMEQRSPRLAKDYFKTSLSTGNSDALFNLGFAYIQLDSIAEARKIFGQVSKFLPNADTTFLNQLLPILASDHLNIDSLTDQQKYWYLFVNKNKINTEDKLRCLSLIENSYLKTNAKLELVDYFIGKQQDSLLSFLVNDLQLEIQNDDILLEKWHNTKLRWLINKNSWKDIQSVLPERKGGGLLNLFLVTKTDENMEEELVEANYRSISRKNPFQTDFILTAASFFNTVQKDEEAAYEILLNAYRINTYAVPLAKAFILQCVHMGLLTYAEEELLALEKIMDQESFKAFQEEFDQEVAKNEENTVW